MLTLKSKLLLWSCLSILLAPSLAARPGKEIYREIRSLYPHLNEHVLRTKIAGAKSPSSLLRTITPYFYLLLAKSPLSEIEPVKTGQTIALESGWCVGDAHVENFGVLLNVEGKAHFRMNDPDDGGPCPLYADFLRLLTSSILIDRNINLNTMIDAYATKLFDRKWQLSETVLELVQMSDGQTQPPPSLLTAEGRLVREDGNLRPVTSEQLAQFQQTITVMFPSGVEILDAIESEKSSGGSGGLTRYRVLYRVKNVPENKLGIIEINEVQDPGIFPLATGIIPSARDRLLRSIMFEQGHKALPLYTIQRVLGMDMILRHRWKGNNRIQMDKFPDDIVGEIANDEAATLGGIHKRTARDVAAYRKAFLQLPKASWIGMAHQMAATFEETFEALKKVHLKRPERCDLFVR